MANHLTSYMDSEFDKSIRLLGDMAADSVLRGLVERTVELSVETLRRGNKILFAGNGGSAADAQHWAGELVSRFNFDRPGLAAIALTTDTSILTAIGNDYGYDHVFSRQVEAIGREGDLLIAISTSGNSANIVRAIHASRERNISVVGFTGQAGGAMAGLCDVCLCMPSTETPKIQEGHEFLGHLICGLIEREIFANEPR